MSPSIPKLSATAAVPQDQPPDFVDVLPQMSTVLPEPVRHFRVLNRIIWSLRLQNEHETMTQVCSCARKGVHKADSHKLSGTLCFARFEDLEDQPKGQWVDCSVALSIDFSTQGLTCWPAG